jgi:FAM192A/Fyv6, N-terminal domain
LFKTIHRRNQGYSSGRLLSIEHRSGQSLVDSLGSRVLGLKSRNITQICCLTCEDVVQVSPTSVATVEIANPTYICKSGKLWALVDGMASTSRETAAKRLPRAGRSTEDVFGSAASQPLATLNDVESPLAAIGGRRPADYSRFVSAAQRRQDGGDEGAARGGEVVVPEDVDGRPLFEVLKAARERNEEKEVAEKAHVGGAVLEEADFVFLDEVARAEREQRQKEQRRERDEVDGFWAAKANIVVSGVGAEDDEGAGAEAVGYGASERGYFGEEGAKKVSRSSGIALRQFVTVKRRRKLRDEQGPGPTCPPGPDSRPRREVKPAESTADALSSTQTTALNRTSLLSSLYSGGSSSSSSSG